MSSLSQATTKTLFTSAGRPSSAAEGDRDDAPGRLLDGCLRLKRPTQRCGNVAHERKSTEPASGRPPEISELCLTFAKRRDRTIPTIQFTNIVYSSSITTLLPSLIHSNVDPPDRNHTSAFCSRIFITLCHNMLLYDRFVHDIPWTLRPIPSHLEIASDFAASTVCSAACFQVPRHTSPFAVP